MGRQDLPQDIDALVLLARDHALIKLLFRDYDRLARTAVAHERRAALVDEICLELSIHLQIEEELFYPAVRSASGGGQPTPDVVDQHAQGKALLAALDELEAGDTSYDDTVAALRDCIVAHMDDEQTWMFPRLRLTGLDATGLGWEMAQRHRTLRDGRRVTGAPARSRRPESRSW